MRILNDPKAHEDWTEVLDSGATGCAEVNANVKE
jgi:hypothetical protein